MKNVLLVILLISGLAIPAQADDIGNFIAADNAAHVIAASNAGGGCFFLHKPPMFKKGRKRPKIEYLDSGNIRIDNKEFTPLLKDVPITK